MPVLSRFIALAAASTLLTGCGLVNLPACLAGNTFQFATRDGNLSVRVTDGDPQVFIGSVNYLAVGSPCGALVGNPGNPSEVKVTRNGTPITPTESKPTVNQYLPEPLGLYLLDFQDKVDPGRYTYEVEGFAAGKAVGKRTITVDTAASPLKGVPQLTVSGPGWLDAKLNWTPVEGAQGYEVTFEVKDDRAPTKGYWTASVSTPVPDKATTFDVAAYLANLPPESRSAERGLVAAATDLKKPISATVRAETSTGRSGPEGKVYWMATSKAVDMQPGTWTLPAPTYDRLMAEERARTSQK